MKHQVEVEPQTAKTRKERSDKGRGRQPYKTEKAVPEVRQKRKYIFKNRTSDSETEPNPTLQKHHIGQTTIVKRFGFRKKGSELTLSKYERAMLTVIKENEQLIQVMGDGSLPFVIGALVSKYSLSFVTELGLIRTKLIKRALNHLQEMNLLRVRSNSKNFLGSGTLELI